MRPVALVLAWCGLFALLSGCNRSTPQSPVAEGPKPTASGTAPGTQKEKELVVVAPIWPGDVKEEWIGQPKDKWPQLALTPHAKFRGHSSVGGGSAFLIQEKDGPILAATHRDIIDASEPRLRLANVEKVLEAWGFFPGDSDRPLAVGAKPVRAGYDILLLSLKEDAPAVTPLKVRDKVPSVGEKLSLIGCRDDQKTQQVLPAVVEARHNGPLFDISVDPTLNLEDFVGGPLVDAKGYVVGMFTHVSPTKYKDGRQRSGIAQDMRGVYSAADRKAGVQLTGRAASAVKERFRKEKFSDDSAARIALQDDDPDAGVIIFDPEGIVHDEDWRGRSFGVAVVVDGDSLERLRGTVVDYVAANDLYFVHLANPYPEPPGIKPWQPRRK